MLAAFDLGCTRSKDAIKCQHPLVQVQACDVSAEHAPACRTGDNPGSAGNVEYLFSCSGLSSTHQVICPFFCNRWYQVFFVKLRRATVELPMVVINHRETLLNSCLPLIASELADFCFGSKSGITHDKQRSSAVPPGSGYRMNVYEYTPWFARRANHF